MVLLVFSAAGRRLALPAATVEMVIPLVELQRPLGAPAGCRGVFFYQGQIVPVLDLGLLVGNEPVRPRLSSRLIIVPRPGGAPHDRLALLAEDVTEIQRTDAGTQALSGTALGGGRAAAGLLGGSLVQVAGSMLQVLDLTPDLLADWQLTSALSASEPPS